MSFLLAFWHAVPGWAWGGGGAALVVLVLLAFFAPTIFANIIESAAKLVAMVPWRKWQTWALIGGALAIFGGYVWLDVHDQALLAGAAKEKADAVAAERAACRKREKDSNDHYAHQLADLQAYIDGRAADEAKHDQALRDAAARERAARAKAEDQLANERTRNVTAEAARLCTLTRGVVLQFNAGAAEANGGDELAIAAAGASGGLAVDAPAGLPLAAYTGAVEGTQRALRACRAQVTGWQRYHAEVIVPWIATAIEAANRCTVKGASP